MLMLCRQATRAEITELAGKLLKSKCKQIHLRIIFGTTMGQTLWYAYVNNRLEEAKTEEGYMKLYHERIPKKNHN